jgi:hypothetical protein
MADSVASVSVSVSVSSRCATNGSNEKSRSREVFLRQQL